MDFDTKAFRAALGCFPTGIAVMTAGSAETSHIGITVNSFTSVSLDPPLVLWCIDRRSRRYPYFAEAPAFTVSILASGHKAVSARLAGQGEHSLDGIALVPTELGPPGLADSLAIFECARESVQVVPRVGGQIRALNRREGEMVAAGEVLGIIDDAKARASLAQAAAAVQSQTRALDQARRDLDRAQALLARGTVTAESRVTLPDLTVEAEYDFTSDITDESGALVARAPGRRRRAGHRGATGIGAAVAQLESTSDRRQSTRQRQCHRRAGGGARTG